jgi:cation:H+ antiporter
MTAHIFIYLLSFAGIWIGSGLAIKSVERLSKILKISSFAVSFLLLGFFTSISEFSVGINSIIQDDPEIYVGNLIGASIVMFLLIIPLLAITGNKINISAELQGFNLPASLVVIALPVILAADGKVGPIDSYMALGLFVFLMICIQSKKGILEKIKNMNQRSGIKAGKELLKMAFGFAIVFVASRFVVEQTLYFSELLKVSPFWISLMVIALGTNIPELSLVIRSIFMKSNQVAFGDFVGSASINTFILGLLTLIYGKPVSLSNSYLVSLVFLLVGLGFFYRFSRTKNSISRKEGLALFLLYLLFLSTEIFIHKNLLGF